MLSCILVAAELRQWEATRHRVDNAEYRGCLVRVAPTASEGCQGHRRLIKLQTCRCVRSVSVVNIRPAVVRVNEREAGVTSKEDVVVQSRRQRGTSTGDTKVRLPIW